MSDFPRTGRERLVVVGNGMAGMRTVEELEHAGLAGLAIEDLVMPARFGSQGKPENISTAEMLGKLHELCRPQILVAEKEHLMLQPQTPQFGKQILAAE